MLKVFKKLKNPKVKKILCLCAVFALCVVCMSVACFADDTTTPTQTMTSTMATSFQGMITDFIAMLGTILPIALSFVSVGLVVSYGIKWFKKISGKA